MIYYSETPLKTWQPNLIMLDLEDNLGHIYVTRNTYDQAVLLSDRFNHDTELVAQRLGGAMNQEDISSYMVAVLPHPINILSPFYNLIDNSVKLSEDNIKQIIGVLSYMSMTLDFNMMLKVPYEVRANLVFTKSILLDYLGHFEDFNFKISESGRHIVSREDQRSTPRSEKEDFLLEEKKEEEQFDLDGFLSDIGWDDVAIPSISAPVEDNSNSTESKDVTKVEEQAKDEVNLEDAYSAIISKFVV